MISIAFPGVSEQVPTVIKSVESFGIVRPHPLDYRLEGHFNSRQISRKVPILQVPQRTS